MNQLSSPVEPELSENEQSEDGEDSHNCDEPVEVEVEAEAEAEAEYEYSTGYHSEQSYGSSPVIEPSPPVLQYREGVIRERTPPIAPNESGWGELPPKPSAKKKKGKT